MFKPQNTESRPSMQVCLHNNAPRRLLSDSPLQCSPSFFSSPSYQSRLVRRFAQNVTNFQLSVSVVGSGHVRPIPARYVKCEYWNISHRTNYNRLELELLLRKALNPPFCTTLVPPTCNVNSSR
eukprot:1181659-Prorocentrum_minimum.AAC.1